MFEQHPVPQQISSYQFRLVGDMTLKQFFQLAAGAVVGLIIYSLPLPGFFKWPLITLAVIGGAAFAFLPIQDRPLEQWLVAFFRSIYAPTIFVWRKPEAPVVYFAADSVATAPVVDEPLPETVPHDVPAHNMDTNEKDFLSKISAMLSGRIPTAANSPRTTDQTPAAAPPPGQLIADQTPPEPVPEKKELAIPEQEVVEVVPQAHEAPKQEPETPGPQIVSMPQTLSGTINVAAQQAQFSPEAAPPSPPTLPNLIVGQVMDAKGKIVEGAILEITDSEGRPVRALKTNKAGHFLIVTPLPNGQYKILIEKDELKFEPVSFTAAGDLIAPIAIKSTNELPEPEPTRATWSL